MIPRKAKVIPYKFILLLAMFLMTLDLSSAAVAYKMVSINSLLAINSGASFIFPVTYALGDIITEVYGYSMARRIVWMSMLLQFVFAILIYLDIHLPSPVFWKGQSAYIFVFNSLIRFIAAGTLANLASNFANIYLVSKFKIPFEGRFFWIRSICATLISDFIMVVIVIIVGFYGKEIDLHNTWVLLKSTYVLEVVYAFALIIPVAYIARILKRAENVDVFDDDINYNPFALTD